MMGTVRADCRVLLRCLNTSLLCSSRTTAPDTKMLPFFMSKLSGKRNALISDIRKLCRPRSIAISQVSPYGSECGTALLDPATGQLEMLRQERYQASFTGGDGLCLLSFDTERMGYTALGNDLRQWTLYSCDPADVCFVDGYACVDAREDRARIMEYFMVHEDAAQLLIESPVIRQKLRLMCGAVRDNFDTTGWGQVRWESLL